MLHARSPLLALAFLAVATLARPLPLAGQLDARMLRQPDVSATTIAFVYAGNVWVVAKTGGVANRLSSSRGEQSFPRFSPDGQWIGFTADYDGNEDIYVMPVTGGVPKRITHHPAPDRMLGWFPDGRSILFASPRESGRQRFYQLYRVAREGGLPTSLPVAYGEFAAVSPDGQWLAYVPQSQDFRTWKRYRGGWNSRIWLYNFATGVSKQVAPSAANNSQPMWHGRTLYFLSDRGPAERANIWAYSLATDSLRQVTRFTDYDIHFPAIGPSDIVFEAGGQLYLLDLALEQSHAVHVQVVTDLSTLKPHRDSAGGHIVNAGISPTGKRAVFEARGDIFTVPAENGPVLDLTQTPGVAERTPAWSPDGKTIAYWTDRSGEYQLAIRPADGAGPEQQITAFGPGFRYRPYWSPDSKKLAFIDQTMTIWVVERDSKRVTKVDQGLYMYEGDLEAFAPAWSADSRWLAYARDVENRHHAIFLFDTQGGARTQVTSGYYDDLRAAFDPEGKYLYLLTNRSFAPIYSDLDNTWIYANTTQIAAVPLRAAVASPLAPRDDEEAAKADAAATDTTKGKKPEQAAALPVEIDLPGFEARLVVLPPEPGNYADLHAVAGKVVYRRLPRTGASDKKNAVAYWDVKERKEETVLDDASSALVSADGEKVLVAQQRRFAIVDLKPAQKFDKPLRTGELALTVDPRAEWRQIFNDVWRFERDYFYDRNMHGVDWTAERARYGKLLDAAVTRSDVNFVIGELIAELNASHTYRGGGDLDAGPQRGTGLLGVDWALDNGSYRIRRILDGAPWDNEVRSPLRAPGVDVKEGDYVLAVNGIPLDPAEDPWAAFDGLADQPVKLTVNSRPTLEGARVVVVKALADESRLRHLAWIEANRRRVDAATKGRIGYVYVPSTGLDGQTELERQLFAQADREGLIIDERFNSGGQIPDRFVELLNRRADAYYAVRDGRDWRWPPAGPSGPAVMLINGWSGSGGDAFPAFFREAKLGPLVGERTWGGIIGITGVPELVDGGFVTVPTFRQYDLEGRWFAEGHGVDPDLAVLEDPAQLAKGVDQQLDAGIAAVLRQLEQHPVATPKRPAAENRSAGASGGGGGGGTPRQ
ncbi:MAG TPA: PDZ domain-containing protein [Gemmatimonadales bacterium]|nr:PDZ domain-containing protein [Gemmatimonadales bacterium]